MTMTAVPTTDWHRRHFRALAAKAEPDMGDGGKPALFVFGHDDPECSALREATQDDQQLLATETNMAHYLESVEFFDGEVDWHDPWPCGTCVGVATPRRFSRQDGDVSDRFEAWQARQGEPVTRHVDGAEVVRDPRQAEAVEFAEGYAGTFGFMVEMREKAQRPSFSPTPQMVEAILKCKMREANGNGSSAKAVAYMEALVGQKGVDRVRYEAAVDGAKAAGQFTAAWVSARIDSLQARPDAEPTPANASQADAGADIDLGGLPAGAGGVGRFAAEDSEGKLRFVRVAQRPNGRTYVDEVIGGNAAAFRGVQREGQPYRGSMADVLAKVLADPAAAARRYGQELGCCSRCGRHLTDETSRSLGVGPECRSKGW